MSRPQIEDKLNAFLTNNLPLSEECEVVYLLVEIRKILDHTNSPAYRVLRFYCDWAVHTRKDKITPAIQQVMEGIYLEILDRINKGTHIIQSPKLMDFADMKELKADLIKFFGEHGLPDSLTTDRDYWSRFKGLLAQILTDQPIIRPCKGIEQYTFLPANAGCVINEITYEKSPAQLDTFKLGGAY